MHQFRINIMVVVATLSVSLLTMLPAHADVGIGADARMGGMGGAGLAVPDIQEAQFNPAFMAYCRSVIGVQMPSLSGQLEGISLNELTKDVKTVNSDQAVSLAESLGKQPVNFGAGLNAGIYLMDVNFSGSATLEGKINPSPTFEHWVTAGANTSAIANFSSSQLTDFEKTSVEAGAVVYAPSVTAGVKIPKKYLSFGELAVGVRLKYAEEYYSKYTLHYDQVQQELTTLDAGQDYTSSKSIAGDIGFLFTPKQYPHTRVALVVNNVIEPQAVSWLGSTEQLAPCTYNVGIAQQVTKSLLVAVDAVNLNTDAQLRAGLEWQSPLWLALRVGYSSGGNGVNGGPTVGIGYHNFCICYSQAAPVTLSQTVTF